MDYLLLIETLNQDRKILWLPKLIKKRPEKKGLFFCPVYGTVVDRLFLGLNILLEIIFYTFAPGIRNKIPVHPGNLLSIIRGKQELQELRD